MPFTDSDKNDQLDGTGITHVSLHTADPTAGNEVSGGSPAYARKAITFNAAATGEKEDDGTILTFDVPAGTTVTHIGYYDALTVGTLKGYDAITSEVFASQGELKVNSVTLSITDS